MVHEDPAERVATAGWGLDYLDRDLSDLSTFDGARLLS